MARPRALPGGEHYPLLLSMNEWPVPAYGRGRGEYGRFRADGSSQEEKARYAQQA